MTIQETIKKAIEGGFEMADYIQIEANVRANLSDPKFWQCLGKAMGWGKNPNEFRITSKMEWYRKWHSFIDHLVVGKSI